MDATSYSRGLYYQHSGRFTIGGVLRATLFGLLIGLPTAWVYAWLIHWNPFVYVSCIATLAFGGLVGASTESFLERGKCRNVIVTALVVFTVMLASFYLSWAVWLHALIGRLDTFDLLLSPLGMWGVIEKVNEIGAWKLRSTVVNGEALWTVWGLEAAMLFGTALYLAVTSMQRATFCESCERTTTSKEGVCFAAAGAAPDVDDKNAVKTYLAGLKQHAAELKRNLETKNFGFLERLGPVPEAALAWYRVDLNTCEKCNKTHTLRILQCHRKMESGKVTDSTKESEVLCQLVLKPSEADWVRGLGEKLVPSMPTLVTAKAEEEKEAQAKAAATARAEAEAQARSAAEKSRAEAGGPR